MKSSLNAKWGIFVLFSAIIILIVISLTFYEVYNLGNHKGFEPDQPISYSHKLHAGDLKISCLYCHFGAEKSKHAGIPPVSVCMNCHKTITTRAESDALSKELFNIPLKEYQKIRDKYKNIDKKVEEWRKLKKLKDPKSKQNAQLILNEINKFLAGLSAEEYKKYQYPVKMQNRTQQSEKNIQMIHDAYNLGTSISWIKIHNLPDHVYFNHAQHFVVGGKSILGREVKTEEDRRQTCKQCHGEVWKMEKVRQEQPLTMGWCIDCHRKSKSPGNPKKTVAQMGGQDCARCHQ